MPYDINQIRNNIQKAVSGKRNDPDEFKPAKVDQNNTEGIKYRFYILPPFSVGETLKGGSIAKATMDNFFIQHGQHWINSKPYSCPRVWDGTKCDLCNFGFELLKKAKANSASDEQKKAISSQWMPSTYYMMNIFFTNFKGNPEELRGKVRYFNATKGVIDLLTAAAMRDESDPEDPSAYGVFFDPDNAFAFDLSVKPDGKYNSYKSSTFYVNNGIPVPMIKLADGTADEKSIAKLLANRVNLFDKIELPDPDKITRLANSILAGDDEDSGGFDQDEATFTDAPQTQATSKPAATTQKSASKPASKMTSEEVGKALLPDPEDEVVGFVEEQPAEAPKPKAKAAAGKPAEPAPKHKAALIPEDDDDGLADILSQLDD
jgi:hypothetical protein